VRGDGAVHRDQAGEDVAQVGPSVEPVELTRTGGELQRGAHRDDGARTWSSLRSREAQREGAAAREPDDANRRARRELGAREHGRQIAVEARVVVVGRLAVRAALNTFGQLTEPMPGTFILRSDHALSDVRRALAAATPEAAQYLIFESRSARLVWSGLPPVAAASIRAVWDAPLNPPSD
jgi:hypothetical protein